MIRFMKTKALGISAGVSVLIGLLLMRIMNAAALSYGGQPPPKHLRSFYFWMGRFALWPNFLLQRLGIVDWKKHQNLSIPTVDFIGWAILGAGIYSVISFIRSRWKPKADPPEEPALVEWDV